MIIATLFVRVPVSRIVAIMRFSVYFCLCVGQLAAASVASTDS